MELFPLYFLIRALEFFTDVEWVFHVYVLSIKKNTLKIKNQEIKFIITDFKNEISVSFKGTIPNLFAEGKGVVAEGILKDKRFFEADRILAKHDENYMPPELKNILSDNAK